MPSSRVLWIPGECAAMLHHPEPLLHVRMLRQYQGIIGVHDPGMSRILESVGVNCILLALHVLKTDSRSSPLFVCFGFDLECLVSVFDQE